MLRSQRCDYHDGSCTAATITGSGTGPLIFICLKVIGKLTPKNFYKKE